MNNEVETNLNIGRLLEVAVVCEGSVRKTTTWVLPKDELLFFEV